MIESIFEQINRITPEELERSGVLEPAKKTGYICPKCGNGTGDSGTGLNVIPNTNKLKCHVCGTAFSAFDIIAAHFGYDGATKDGKSATIEKAKKLFNWLEDSSFFAGNKKVAAPMNEPIRKKNSDKPKTNFSGEYVKWRAHLEGFINSRGGSYRGLPLEFLRKYGVGYNPQNGGWLILPYDDFHYFQRAISENEENPKRHKGGKGVYNINAISLDTPNFMVEGEIDALSISRFIHESVATGGASECQSVINDLNRFYKSAVKKPKFIVMFDNNDKGAGQIGAEKLVAALNAAGYPAVNVILDEKNRYDANEFLQKDFDGFASRIFDIWGECDEKLSEIAAQKSEAEGNGLEFGEYFNFFFDREIRELQKFSERSTGFENIDNQLKFVPGFYTIGAVSSLGKTTFAWQMIENFARKGETCIYCSYEMSQLELFSKSIARELFKRDSSTTLTAADIRRGAYSETMQKVVADFKRETFALRVIELTDEKIDDLLERLKAICATAEKPPIIVIDYLQFIPSDKDTRQAIDETVRKLKNFQRDTNTTFIVISSLNRASYTTPVSFESFKESGSIEYSADCVLGLQLQAVNDLKDGMGNVKKNREIMKKAKNENPRKVQMVCLKNRNGRDFVCNFKYYPSHDYFEPCDESDFDPLDNDGFASSNEGFEED